MAISIGSVSVKVELELTHYAPQGDSALTVCCGHSPFDLKQADRITNDVALVTCPGAWLNAKVPE